MGGTAILSLVLFGAVMVALDPPDFRGGQGTKIIGKYDSVVAFGQKRVLVIWQRLIRPDGSSLVIDNLPATDEGGYAPQLLA